jgi:hypothetical protein
VTAGKLTLLWIGIVAAPLAWAAQITLGYGLVENGCASEGGAGEVFGVQVETAVYVFTAVMAVVAAIGGASAVATWLAPGTERRGYVPFLGFTALLASGLLLLVIVLAGASAFALDACAQS